MLGVGRGGSGGGRWVAQGESVGPPSFSVPTVGRVESSFETGPALGGVRAAGGAGEAQGPDDSWASETGALAGSSHDRPSASAPAPLTPSAERDAWGALAAVAGLGPLSFGLLVGQFGGASRVLEVASGGRGVERLMAVVHNASVADPAQGRTESISRE